MKLRARNQAIARRRSALAHFNVESLEHRLLLAADWQNPLNPLDVDASQTGVEVAAIDVLLIINEMIAPQIAHPTTMQLPTLEQTDIPAPPFVDVNGDGYVSALDAIQVINVLAENANHESGASEGGSFAPSSVMVGTRAALHHGVQHDTLVNTTTRHYQSYPDIATGPQGVSVIVWQSVVQDGSSWGVFGQRYDAAGNKVGGEFQVNTHTRGSQRSPAVAMDDHGGFMVVWQSLGQDRSSWGIYGQRFDADGNRVGNEVRINQTTRGLQMNPDIAFSPGDEGDDTFTAVWEGWGNGDFNGIFSRTFSASDATFGDETLVNTWTLGDQSAPAIDGFSNGVAIAWHGYGPGDPIGTFMRTLGTTSSASSSEQIQVNIVSRGVQTHPAISANDDGSDIVVAWRQIPESGIGVWARQFTDGVGANSVIQVNQTQLGTQWGPAVDHLAEGGFVAAWYGRGRGDFWGTFSRTFDESGDATSDEILANQTVRCGQIKPTVATANSGYIVSWQGRGEGDHLGIFARFEDSEITGPFALAPIPDQTIDEETTLSVTPQIIDLDGEPDDVTFSLLAAPPTATIDPVTGTITWLTTEADGPSSVEFIVEAREGAFADTQAFNVNVLEINVPPTIESITDPAPVLVGTEFDFTVIAFDTDIPEQVVTLTATTAGGGELPSWLSFTTSPVGTGNAVAGRFQGTPSESDVGSIEIAVTASDTDDASTTETFTIVVVEMLENFAPQVNDHAFNVAPEATNGTAVGTVLAFDRNVNDTLTYAISSGNENGAFAINSATGEITVADSSMLVGGTSDDLIVTVTDDIQASGTGSVLISVTDNPLVVRYILSAEDTGGSPITSVAPGQEFDLIMSTEDQRDPAAGVFAPFADVTYLTDSVSLAGQIVHSQAYGTAAEGNTDTPGLIDEVGGLDGLSPIGPGVFEVFRIRMQAALLPAGSSLQFATNPADEMMLHATLVFLSDDPVPTDQIEYGTLTLTVDGSSSLILLPPAFGSATELADDDVIFSPLSQTAVLGDRVDTGVGRVLPLESYASATDTAFGHVDRASWWREVEDQRDALQLLEAGPVLRF